MPICSYCHGSGLCIRSGTLAATTDRAPAGKQGPTAFCVLCRFYISYAEGSPPPLLPDHKCIRCDGRGETWPRVEIIRLPGTDIVEIISRLEGSKEPYVVQCRHEQSCLVESALEQLSNEAIKEAYARWKHREPYNLFAAAILEEIRDLLSRS